MAARFTSITVGLLLFLLIPASAGAQNFKPKKTKIPQEDIDKAVEKGIAYLRQHGKNVDDSKGVRGYELVFYTFVHGGMGHHEEVFKEYLKIVVDREPERTYNVTLAANALCELDKKGYQWKLAQYAQFFVDNQCDNGQWSYGEKIPLDTASVPPQDDSVATGSDKGQVVSRLYGVRVTQAEEDQNGKSKRRRRSTEALPRIIIKKQRKGPPAGDNSNTQYAALGLRACHEAGIFVEPQVVTKALDWWYECQCGDKSWAYCKDGQDRSEGWGSMTVGGVGSVAIYNWMLRRPWQKEPHILKAFEWLDKEWSVEWNPKTKEMGKKEKFHYYYLYGLERAAMLYGTDFIGRHDWYDEGAKYLLKVQKEDGSWKNDHSESTVEDTCYAILFLRRATKPLRPMVATGR